MTTFRAWALPINPAPWAIGKFAAVPRKNGKAFVKSSPNRPLMTYQEAVRQELRLRDVQVEEGMYVLRISLSRQLEQYKTVGGRTQTNNPADVSNMFKATEDALQSIAITNDREVLTTIGQSMGKQGLSTIPYVLIELLSGITSYRLAERVMPGEFLSNEVMEARDHMFENTVMNPVVANNEWSPE